MLQLLLFGCVVFPVLAALAVLCARHEGARRSIVFVGTGVTALCAVALALCGSFTLAVPAGNWLGSLVTGLDFLLLFYLLYLTMRIRHALAASLVLAQIAGILYLDLVLLPGTAGGNLIFADPLSLLMVLVISLVGGLICVFGLGYMKEHEDHLRLLTTRQPRFFFVLLLFLGAMNGLVLADSLAWVFLCWEVTTLCSYLLISHDGTRLAKANAARALWMNLTGGVAFVTAMLLAQKGLGTMSIQELLALAGTPEGHFAPALLLPLAFLCFAGFTKSAQFPFQSWLCGAMVAPTPVSALLHSSTMVKAGVYLILRLAPALVGTRVGGIVLLMGAFTFLAASALAVGQSNGKKILAYSTIANLGLIVACAGIGTPAAITAAWLLILFHAVSKALLFLCVGAIEQHIGSRDIEDMRGLCQRMPRTALLAVVGMFTMMLPPFGALLAKWMALEAAAASLAYMPLLVLCIAFGSALTVLFWARWAGCLLGINPIAERPVCEHQESTVRFPLYALAVGAIALSLLTPLIYGSLESAIAASFGIQGLFTTQMGVFSNGVGVFAVYPIFVLLGLGVWYALRESRKAAGKLTLPYMSGIQAVQEKRIGFNGPLNQFVEVKNANYYLHDWFGEDRLTGRCNIIALVLMVIMLGGLL